MDTLTMRGQGDAMTDGTKKRRTSRILWTLAAVLLAGALGLAVRSQRSGVNELSWNVRDAVAKQLKKEVSALTTQDLASVTGLELRETSAPFIKLPASLGRLQRFVPDRKTVITDQDLVHLEKLTALRKLWLNGTRVTDAGLVHLAELSALQGLALNETQVTDVGLVHLAKLDNLQWLGLPGTMVTDVGLVHLAKLSALQQLALWGTQVTDAGEKRFAEARAEARLPECFIQW